MPSTSCGKARKRRDALPVHRADNRLIGSGGYKGPPGVAGTVEIGYEITPAYRNSGYATEMTKGLVEHAFIDQRVTAVIAHTLGEENPSTAVLQKCGFHKTAEFTDPDEGTIWNRELQRP
jgi:RimJ/RimL family protein N-acetyltransferase